MEETHSEYDLDLKEISNLLKQNKKLEAVKLVKEATGWGLKESKDYIENIEDNSEITFSEKNSENQDLNISEYLGEAIFQEVKEMVAEGLQVQAIKLVCDRTDLNLLSGKNLVENIENGESHFTMKSFEMATGTEVRMTNTNGVIVIKYKTAKQKRKTVDPNDPDWETIKNILGNKPEILAYEKAFQQNAYNSMSSNKSKLFLEEKSSFNIKTIILGIAVILAIIYFIMIKK